MIPSVISPQIESNAEKRIFEWFRDDPDTDGWVVLHSLGISNHRTTLYGELDFFVIAPRLGIFALEVKGGRVKCEEGIWYFTNKYDQTTIKTRGPFAQANEGMFSLMDAVKKKFGTQNRLSRLLYGTGVMFPDIVFDVEGTEGEQWQVYDSRNGTSVSAYIRRLAKNTANKWEAQFGNFPKDKLPDSKDVKDLVGMLRRNFDIVVSIGRHIKYTEEALINLTEEQFRCLDQLEDNPRCLISGAAGTGKTLLAIEEAKRAVVLKESVAIFCYNSMLSSWLKQYFENQPLEVRPAYIGTIHAWMMKIVGGIGRHVDYDGDNPQGFYNEELPLMALEALEKASPWYDRIIIDEAQDIIGTDAFDILDAALKNGLDRGKWALFGDFTSQAIYSNGVAPEEKIEMLKENTSFINFKLKINCRNTKQIGDEIKYLTGFDSSAYLWSKVAGIPVEYLVYSSREEQIRKLEALLDKLIKDGVTLGEISILSPHRRESSVVAGISKYKISDYRPDIRDSIVFSTIQAYKGLENCVVIITDVDTFSQVNLVYVGLSRARSGLFILETDIAEKEHVQLLLKAVSR